MKKSEGELVMSFSRILLSTFLIGLIALSLLQPTHGALEIRRDDIRNFLDYNLHPGIGLLDFVFTLDSYDILEIELPNRTQILAYFNGVQSNEGTWDTGLYHYVPNTAQVLMFFNRSGVKPAKSLEPFFLTVDTWEEVNAHVKLYDSGNYWGGLWGYITSYVIYKAESPPWTQDYLNKLITDFDTWAYDNHQRTHVINNLFQLQKPVPRIDDVVNITLQQQRADGSWEGLSDETIFMIGALELTRGQYSVNQTLIDSAISRGVDFVRNCYKSIESQGKIYGGFARNPSDEYPHPRATALGAWLLLNPASDVWLRWFSARAFFTFNISLSDLNYGVVSSSSSTLTNFRFNQSLKRISLDVTGVPAISGYCSVSIPKALMWSDLTIPWIVTLGGSPVSSLAITENVTFTSLYFTYTHSPQSQELTVQSGYVIPEFPSAVTLFILFAVITSVMAWKKRALKSKALS